MEYRTAMIRRTYRCENGKVKHDTFGNVFYLFEHVLNDLKASLDGATFLYVASERQVHRSLSHRHIHAISTFDHDLGFENMLDENAGTDTWSWACSPHASETPP